jgi:hypothetical protein
MRRPQWVGDSRSVSAQFIHFRQEAGRDQLDDAGVRLPYSTRMADYNSLNFRQPLGSVGDRQRNVPEDSGWIFIGSRAKLRQQSES